MRYKLVIFDFDGTLADSGPWFARVINELAEEFNFKPLSLENPERIRRLEAGEVLKQLELPLWKMPRVLVRIRQLAARDAASIQLFPGIDRMLARLSETGHTLAIVTSNAEAPVRTVLGPAVAALIPHFRCGASLFGKDAKLKALLKRAAVPPENAIYVGDEIRDATAARKAGIAFGAVAWGYTHPEALAAQNPDHLFETVEGLVKQIVGC